MDIWQRFATNKVGITEERESALSQFPTLKSFFYIAKDIYNGACAIFGCRSFDIIFLNIWPQVGGVFPYLKPLEHRRNANIGPNGLTVGGWPPWRWATSGTSVNTRTSMEETLIPLYGWLYIMANLLVEEIAPPLTDCFHYGRPEGVTLLPTNSWSPGHLPLPLKVQPCSCIIRTLHAL